MIASSKIREAIMRRLSRGLLIGAAIAAFAPAGGASAQQLPSMTNQTANIKRIPLQKFDVPGANYETVIGIAEIAPNANVGRHTHPGIEGGYLIEGGMTLMVEGQPPKEIKPGDSWQIPPGAIHDAKAGSGGAKVIASYVVEKGKPLASPAP
jgi:quercetin dioxygenase-like cupin family protein